MSAVPLFVVAVAIAAVSIATRTTGGRALMRAVAALAFVAWGVAQLTSGQLSGRFDDLAIALFVADAAYGLTIEMRAVRRRHGEPELLCGCGRPCQCAGAGSD